MRRIFHRGGAIAWLQGFCILAAASGLSCPAAAQDAVAPAVHPVPAPDAALADSRHKPRQKSAARYFIEFRSRNAVSYGHTFVLHGRVGSKLTEANVAGLHPDGDSSIVYMLGHLVPVPAATGFSDGDLEDEYMTARYRIELSEPEYQAVAAYIKQLQAHSPLWNAVTYNCNVFVATIAQFMGLQTPHPLLMPKDFIDTLRTMNGASPHALAQFHARRPAL